MEAQLEHHLCRTLGVPRIDAVQTIQGLWSGCGQVARVWMDQAEQEAGTGTAGGTVVIKHVKMPEQINHPRGWDTDRSAQRKVRSYGVESNWYARWSTRNPTDCRVPRYLGHASWGDERLLILEDIDASGFDRRLTNVSLKQLDACIRWLASFHATFLGKHAEGLWDKGTYWHLDTRPDEYEALEDGPLKRAAKVIDSTLDASPFQTIVHGDAKLANFCFSNNDQVAAVDFQYVGGGCGMKDLAYLIGGCLDSDACYKYESHVLTTYFNALKQSLATNGSTVDTNELEADWRRLYPYAWADFERFLQGWSPGHWKISGYGGYLTDRVLKEIDI